ncbi:hypothetical protein FGG08_001148 [Glutinoglossum americanum]|uniref:DUF7730 domain-containing protein n=1 Tax=Glutinoglossum americanum TaxID=1670608 RepID=A0A9P8L342_9PEZI|nr:hypothetical protein FGG08_001148 [Glutinoglossum americanum]
MTSRLFSLPLEIRREIYMLVLYDEDTVWVNSPISKGAVKKPSVKAAINGKRCDVFSRADFYFNGPTRGLSTALLLVNRKIHKESSEILYSKNVFGFIGDAQYTDLLRFLWQIGRANRSRLERIEIKLPTIQRGWVSVRKGRPTTVFNPKDDKSWTRRPKRLALRYHLAGEGVEESLRLIEAQCPNLWGIWLRIPFDELITVEKTVALKRFRRMKSVLVFILEVPHVEGNQYANIKEDAFAVLREWEWADFSDDEVGTEKYFLF